MVPSTSADLGPQVADLLLLVLHQPPQLRLAVVGLAVVLVVESEEKVFIMGGTENKYLVRRDVGLLNASY